jgi:hypothetical protein
VAEVCDGVNNACPSDAKSTAECRASGGICDVAEVCDGVNNACPADAKSTAECRASSGVCDVAESCDGCQQRLPDDDVLPNGTTVPRLGGRLRRHEAATASARTARLMPRATASAARPAGSATSAETCDGVNNACPTDVKKTTQCRASAGVCDLAESCDG